MIAALERVATKHEIALGPVNDKPDPVIQKIVATWPTATDSSRGLTLGLPNDDSLDQVAEDYIADFLWATNLSSAPWTVVIYSPMDEYDPSQ